MLIESSITGLFRLLLVAFLVYFVISFFVRYMLPLLIRNSLHSFYKGYQEEEIKYTKDKSNKDGEISIEYLDKNNRRSKPGSDDEYVDFEEIT